MNWSQKSDNYCERTDLSYWSEPLNAISNAAFVIAAAWMWRRCVGAGWARALCAVLFMIGIGSFLFHTHATRWAEMADVVPIGAFILLYLFLVNRDFVGLPWWGAVLATAGFVPYAIVIVPVLDRIPFVMISNFYWSVPILLSGYAVFFIQTHAANGQRDGWRGRIVVRVDLHSLERRKPVCALAHWHPFHLACPECLHVGVDDRSLPPSGVRDLMDFDNIAVRIVKEHLMPLGGGSMPPIGIRNTLRIQMGFERLDVIGAVGDMAPLYGVDGVPCLEANC